MALSTAWAADWEYPVTKRVDHTDDYHGTTVADPFRWLEDDVRESDDVAKWVEEQNKVTFAYLESLLERQAIEDRLTELWDYEKYSAPFKHGGRYYFSKNDGLQNQSVLYVQQTLDDGPEVLIDPNQCSAGINSVSPSSGTRSCSMHTRTTPIGQTDDAAHDGALAACDR